MGRYMLSLLFLLLPLSAYAQTGSNVFLGYSYLNADSLAGNRANLNGWNGSLEGKIFPFVGIVADLSGHYGEQDFGTFTANTHQHTFVFGPRVSVSVGKIRPFAHYLVGAGHISVNSGGADTSFAQAIGGGLDYKLIPLIAWRFQGDFLRTRYFDTKQDNFRFSTGVVLHF
ncbi:MAG TPA: outer membrane beta-barrel protein [Terriglobales bacterium]|nr:outer membrane beta-barrel protein [Terriglobales bacterium]